MAREWFGIRPGMPMKCGPVQLLRVAVCCITALLWPGSSCLAEEAAPTAEQIVTLLRASANRFRSWEASYRCSNFKADDAGQPTGPARVEFDVMWRQAGLRSYGESTRLAALGAGSKEGKVICQRMVTSEFCREVILNTGSKPRGMVKRPEHGDLETVVGTSLQSLLTSPLELMADATSSNSEVQRDLATGRLKIRTHKANGFTVSLEVDPTKGWVPVACDLSNDKGVVIQRIRANDYRLVGDSAWLPYTYSMQISDFVIVYSVDSVVVDVDIPPEKLEVMFPDDTKVTDKILNKMYRVRHGVATLAEKFEADSVNGLTGQDGGKSAPTTRVLFTDEELRQAAAVAGVTAIQREPIWVRWLWPIVMFVAGLAGTIAVVRVRRGRRPVRNAIGG